MQKMKSRRIFLFLVIFVLIVKNVTPKTNGRVEKKENHARGSKRMLSTKDGAFDNDINKCLFAGWTTTKDPNGVLSGPVQCQGSNEVQLCYGTTTSEAQFAVCYNTNTLIPEFTGHVVSPGIKGSGRDDEWTKDKGNFAPKAQSEVTDYEPYAQKTLYDNFHKDNQFFCAKGHLTPNADFDEEDKRMLTMITTNIAPQWQNVNGLNWAGVEKAVRAYATTSKNKVYVFTGVGGEAKNSKDEVIKLNKRVLAPKWYWKAVCDPVVKQSIVLVGENAIGITKKEKVVGCNGRKYTKNAGVIYCNGLEGASKAHPDFKLPPFSDNCNPSEKGKFMDGLFTKKRFTLKMSIYSSI